MHWRDIHSDGPDRRLLGLDVTVAAEDATVTRPTLHMQAGRPRLMRLMAGSWPLLWARVDDDHCGYWYVRRSLAEGSPGLVVPPVTALEAREQPGAMGSDDWYLAWARFFARKLQTSPASPLHVGRWRFVPSGARPPVRHLERVAQQPAHGYDEWDFGDDLPPLALRLLSSPDDDRVRAWRRSFREGALPPVLLMWVSGLDRHVVLDGHERLVAALAEGETPPVLSLLRLQEHPVAPDAARARAITEEMSAQLLAATNPDLWPPRPFRVESANRLLIEAHDDRPKLSLRTRAWPLAGGVRTWCAQVRQALEARGPSGEDVRAEMLADLAPRV